MRIGVDCRLAGKRHGGIGRYIEHITTQMVSKRKDITWVLFFFSQSQVSECFSEVPEHVEIIITPIKHYTVTEQLFLPFFFFRAQLHLLHIPHFNIPLFYPKKMIVTIHDLLWHEYKGTTVTTLPAWMYWFKYIFYRMISYFSIKRAAHILVPSETIKKTITSYYPWSKKKITTTLEGAELITHQHQQTSSDTKKIVSSHKPYLLYVGSLYPHKNIRILIEALTELPQLKLLIVGSRSVFQKNIEQEIKKRKLTNRITFMGYVSDTDLQYFYQQSEALVQPSLSEGFGLTGVEALQLGTPVLASDIPIFKEIYKNSVLYFNPRSVQSFVRTYQELKTVNKNNLRSMAKILLSHYSWSKTADQTITIYEKIIAHEI